MLKKTALITLLIIALAAVGTLAYQQLAPTKEAGAPEAEQETGQEKPGMIKTQEAPTTPEPSQIDTSDWKVYVDDGMLILDQEPANLRLRILSTSQLGSQVGLPESAIDLSLLRFPLLSPSKEVIAFTIRGPVKDWVGIVNLEGSVIKFDSFPYVEEYHWSENGRYLIMKVYGEREDSKGQVWLFDLLSPIKEAVFQGVGGNE